MTLSGIMAGCVFVTSFMLNGGGLFTSLILSGFAYVLGRIIQSRE